MKDIGIGVIGIGMESNLLPINDVGDSRLQVRALCSQGLEKVARLAAQWDIGFPTTDYRQLIDRDDIQVIAVYSPDHQHIEQARLALQAGKHVICTKPMCNRLEDAIELVRLVEK